ncbi:unnamed protein product [Arabis nemorensis]|uniref:Uncharacterized protein n=1 Tax=Arabis nemorensis TaxID=586526 RepID=A0A565BU12_9BRAS|nr:unnamed protein product [Arabis nemorensis]
MSTLMDGVDGLVGVVKATDQEFGTLSASSSSIGKNSADEEGGENEAESPYKGPLDMMDSLEQALPIGRGISNFYKGKSKSFSNLKETEATQMKNLGKPRNPYSSRRKNLRSHRIRIRGGISKNPLKTAFTLTLTKDSSSADDDDSSSESQKHGKPLHPRHTNGSCVPVIDSPSAHKNTHNIIC